MGTSILCFFLEFEHKIHGINYAFLANDPKVADIVWTSLQVDEEVKNVLGLSQFHYSNQFPFEECLVMKHRLADTIHMVFLLLPLSCPLFPPVYFSIFFFMRREAPQAVPPIKFSCSFYFIKALSLTFRSLSLSSFHRLWIFLVDLHQALGSPDWLQPTYNLESQLSELIGDYCLRKREKEDNIWILKPWNMARSIDTTVTADLPAIIRLMESGPKICQKYIHQPSLFRGKKFDLRYIVLVRSMNPVEIFLLDVFWVIIYFVYIRVNSKDDLRLLWLGEVGE